MLTLKFIAVLFFTSHGAIAADPVTVAGLCGSGLVPNHAGLYLVNRIGDQCVFRLQCDYDPAPIGASACKDELARKCTTQGKSGSVNFKFRLGTSWSPSRDCADVFAHYVNGPLISTMVIDFPEMEAQLAACKEDPACVQQIVARLECAIDRRAQGRGGLIDPPISDTVPPPFSVTAQCTPDLTGITTTQTCEKGEKPSAEMMPMCTLTEKTEAEKAKGKLDEWGKNKFVQTRPTLGGHGPALLTEAVTWYCTYRRPCSSDFDVVTNLIGNEPGARCKWLPGAIDAPLAYCGGSETVPPNVLTATTTKKFRWERTQYDLGNQPDLDTFEAAAKAECDTLVEAFEAETRKMCAYNMKTLRFGAQGVAMCCADSPICAPTPVPFTPRPKKDNGTDYYLPTPRSQ